MKITRILAATIASSALLAACGGGGTDTLTTPPPGGGSGGGGSGGGAVVQTEMGATVNGAFARGVVGTSLAAGAQLSAGGSTQLTVQFRTVSTGAPTTDTITVNLASSCPSGTVTISPASVNTANGQATATYSYSGGYSLTQDTVNATVASGGTNLVNSTATTTIALAASQVGSIEFASASPTNIGLSGTGRNETSVVTFRVRDQAGGPRPNASVTFTLDTSVGGITFSPATATTGTDGTVQTTVKSGTVATTVRVTASTTGANGQTISTTSSQLTVTTGLPTQNRMSISVDKFNPEAWLIDGVRVQVTARLADRFGNPAPDGTAVQFQTSFGAITPQCTTATTTSGNVTESGVCVVTWVSQGARPSSGRAGILATAIGEESYTESNGNGRFDSGDQFPAAFDLAEPFLDVNEDSCRSVDEPFFDFNNNQAWDTAGAAAGCSAGNLPAGNARFDGLLCTPRDTPPAGSPGANAVPCGSPTTGIGAATALVLADSSYLVSTLPDVTWNLATTNTLRISVTDSRGQPPAVGTTIVFSGGNGSAVGAQNCTVPNTASPGAFVCSIVRSADSTSDTKTGVITVSSPGGVITPPVSLNVSD